jgi:hypothetical protein
MVSGLVVEWCDRIKQRKTKRKAAKESGMGVEDTVWMECRLRQ